MEASLNHLSPQSLTRPAVRREIYSDAPVRLALRRVKVPIRDARAVAGVSLDREGFQLVHHASAVTDFRDLDTVRSVYPGEMERLILELAGARAARMRPIFVLRSADPEAPVKAGPLHLTHCDFSAQAAERFARTMYFPDVELRPGQRIAGFNIWRALSPPPQPMPLAICDARSVAPADLVSAVIDGRAEEPFDSQILVHNPAHRWYYFPDMQRDEVLVFKSYDSDPSRPVFVPHSAFRHPDRSPDWPPRMSIETRVFAYF